MTSYSAHDRKAAQSCSCHLVFCTCRRVSGFCHSSEDPSTSTIAKPSSSFGFQILGLRRLGGRTSLHPGAVDRVTVLCFY